MKITPKDKVYIINAYQNELVPMIQLAKEFDVTRQAVHKILRQEGVDTSKGRLPVSCSACGKEIMRPRCQIRARKHLFCSQDCYTAYLNAGGKYIPNRHSSRIARALVKEHYNLTDKNIVHHKDKNQYNNSLDNLCVFKNQGDHTRHHRGFDIDPIWDGSTI